VVVENALLLGGLGAPLWGSAAAAAPEVAPAAAAVKIPRASMVAGEPRVEKKGVRPRM
jgi:hypothetical protein